MVYNSTYYINLHSFIAFISVNIFNVFLLFFCGGLIIFIFVFANISPNNCICIHICSFLVSPNIFVSGFIKRIGSINIHISICQKMSTSIYLYLPKFVNLNIFVFVFEPENCIQHTLSGKYFRVSELLGFLRRAPGWGARRTGKFTHSIQFQSCWLS